MTGIVDSNHALLVGEILGTLMHAEIAAEPVMHGNDYTNVIRIERPSGIYFVTVTNVQEA